MKFKLWRFAGLEIRSNVDVSQQAMRLGARAILDLEALRPVPFFYGIVEVLGRDQCSEQILSISSSVWCGMPSLTKNSRHVGAGGGSIVHSPRVRR